MSFETPELEKAMFVSFVEKENALVAHCYNLPAIEDHFGTTHSLEELASLRYKEGGRELMDEVLETTKNNLGNACPRWTSQYKILLGQRDVAFKKCVSVNIRLVQYLANKWAYRGKLRVPKEDLIQEGMIGLMKAVSRFNPYLGFRFISYGTWAIKQQMRKYSSENKELIKIPYGAYSTVHAVTKDISKPQSELDAGSEEILRKGCLKEETVHKARVRTISLETPLNPNSSETIWDTLSSRDPSPIWFYEDKERSEVVNTLLADLDDREKAVILNRFGFKDGDPKTLQEIGDNMGLTRERIRQIEERVLRQMRIRAKEHVDLKIKEYVKHGYQTWA
jgi:RNA polymerase primary sigma factor